MSAPMNTIAAQRDAIRKIVRGETRAERRVRITEAELLRRAMSVLKDWDINPSHCCADLYNAAADVHGARRALAAERRAARRGTK